MPEQITQEYKLLFIFILTMANCHPFTEGVLQYQTIGNLCVNGARYQASSASEKNLI